MQRARCRWAVFGLLFTTPLWCAPQNGQNQPGPGESSSSKATGPQQESRTSGTAKPDSSSAEEDIEVGSYYLRKGNANAAIPRLEEAVRLDSKNPKARLLLAEAYEKTHDDDSAVKTYQEYLKAFPNVADTKRIEKRIEKLEQR